MPVARQVVVVGAGVFGVSASIELAKRGHHVTLMDSGLIPHPHAASTDISKVIRMDYGADQLYTSMMQEAFPIWDRWNREWDEPLYHQVGFLLLTQDEMKVGSLEYDSFALQQKLGYSPQRINSEILKAKYPAWNSQLYTDGYLNPRAGWAESGQVVKRLAQDAVAAGVVNRENLSVVRVCDDSGHVSGVIAGDGSKYPADLVVLAAGTWSPLLSSGLAEIIISVEQPVFHFRPRDPEPFRAPVFPVWSADMGKTGWYGFPINKDGVVKVANHGPGRKAHPDNDRSTTPEQEAKFRTFLKESLPALSDAPIEASKTCFYSDSWDGDFYIDHDPERPGLVYATGGSGHGFKFAPVLGTVIADVVEHKPNPYAKRFAWRARTGSGKRNRQGARVKRWNKTVADQMINQQHETTAP